MWKVAATLVVLLLLQDALILCSARFVPENLASVTAFRRRLSAEFNEPRTVAVDLMHVQHVDSPYMQPNLTLLQRAQNAAKSSKQRLSYLSGRVIGKKKPFGVTHVVLTSPVIAGQGAYIMQIRLGTPSRTLLALVDTGSDLIWFQCSPCTKCYTEPDLPVYDPTTSSSYSALPCTDAFCTDLPSLPPYPSCSTDNTCLYDYSYGDNSFTIGSMAYETFGLAATDGSNQSFPQIGFGCGHDNEGSNQGYDGLVGFGQGNLSLVSQLGTTLVPVFSYCLVSYASATTKTSPLLLGSAGSAALTLTYTPLITNTVIPTFYYVNLTGITVNAQPVSYPSGTFDIDPTTGAGGIIVDSGTTITQLVDAAYTPFRAAIAALVTYPTTAATGFDLCYDTSSVSTPAFPAVVFQFDGVDLTLPSDNVFLAVDNAGTTYCLFFASAAASLGISIFGNVQQQNFQIAFDIVNAQVGFAATTC